MYSDNISAIATPHGKGGIAIIRISGKNPLEIAGKMFLPRGKTAVRDFQPYRMTDFPITDYAYISARRIRIRAKTWWNFNATAAKALRRGF